MAQARYTIQIGDEKITFEGPDGLTDNQIEDLADKQLRTAKPGQVFPHSEYVGIRPAAPKRSAVGTFFRNLPHDAFLNLDDELAAAGNAAIPGMAALENATGMGDSPQQSMYDGNSKGFSDAYKQNMAAYKGERAADEEQHPTAAATGRITGLLSSLPIAGRAIAARTPQLIKDFMTARPILSSAALGGTTGAVSGAGAGEGNRGQSAAMGLITGTALGAGTAAAFEAAPAVADYVKILFNKGEAATQRAISQLATALKRDGYNVDTPEGVDALHSAIQNFTGKPVSIADVGAATRARAGVGLRSPSDQQIPAIDRVTERGAGTKLRLASDIRANVAPRTDVHALNDDLVAQRASEAEKLRQRALFEDKAAPEILYRGGSKFDPNHPGPTYFTPDEEAAKSYVGMHEERFQTPGTVESFVADLKNPLDLSQNTVPGNDIVALAKQAGIRPENIEYGTTSSWFDPDLNPPGSSERLINALKQRGYDGVRTMDVPWSGSAREEGKYIDAVIPFSNKAVVPTSAAKVGSQSRIINDPQLQQLARLPLAQRALGKALDQAEAERALLATTGKDTSHLPDLSRGSDLDVRSFDYLKRYLDDEVNRLYKRGDTSTFSAAEANQVKELRNAIRERLRQVVPEYGDYLDAYSGSSDMIKALEEGQSFDNLAPEQIAAQQADRSTAGQELYRVGTARSLLDRIKSTGDGRSPATRILNSDESREQLAATGVTPENMGRLNRSVQQERTLNLLPLELQGSQTQARQMAQRDADAASSLHLPWNPASKFSWAGALLRGTIDKLSTARNAQVNEALLPRITATDPATIEATIKELEQHGATAAARALRRSLSAQRAAALLGTKIGGPVALPMENDDGR